MDPSRKELREFILACPHLSDRRRHEVLGRLELVGEAQDDDRFSDHDVQLLFHGFPDVQQYYRRYREDPTQDPAITEAIERSTRMG
ncbi:MAG: hypothetical protein HY567_03405 [Candidatus Kerfeldbacteria bacterium]|nr:hypothetical protein [Candidatus Kerfeldbacteria bacterium]